MLHTVSFEGQTIYSGNTIPIVSSDGVSNVLIGTTTGLLLFDTEAKTTTKLNNSIATGLAYDGYNFMELQANGTLFSISLTDGSLTDLGSGYTRLYDTTDGYLISTGNNTSITGTSGTSKPANGNYTTIRVTIT